MTRCTGNMSPLSPGTKTTSHSAASARKTSKPCRNNNNKPLRDNVRLSLPGPLSSPLTLRSNQEVHVLQRAILHP
ncbi:hypothetical protein EYF80_042667 [Liparis tanakae]|uniref:Uncharacterized protein n=1 Tax=Liparis tanakae TaxID=230148 RepID=A0A4Z2G2N9_9TELE|nr:hypothetical protein EYF80_042667 [Liparis tanakae]